MHIRTKRIKQIVMTDEECEAFRKMVIAAQVGQFTHSAETQLNDGSYLGVTVLTPEEVEAQKQAENKLRNDRERAAYERRNGLTPTEPEVIY